MWSPEFLNDSFKFSVWFRQIISEIFYVCGDFLDFSIDLINQIASLCNVSFQSVNLIIDHIDIIVNGLLSFFPFLHFFQFDFSDMFIEVFPFGVIWKYCVVRIVWQKLGSHICESLEFVFVGEGCTLRVGVFICADELFVDFVLFLKFLDDLDFEIFGVLLILKGIVQLTFRLGRITWFWWDKSWCLWVFPWVPGLLLLSMLPYLGWKACAQWHSW